MRRRHALTLLVGLVAGCSNQPTDPTTTRTSTATGRPPTTTATTTADEPGTDTETESPTGTDTPPASGIDAAVAGLNDIYAELQPTLETLTVTGLDEELLTSRLRTVKTALDGVAPSDSTEEARIQSLSDTRWIFDRLTRALLRVREVYGIHPPLRSAYDASTYTDEAASQSNRFQTLANEASSSVGTAVLRYDSMSEFDPALDVTYAAFEDQIFRVSDTVNGLVPFGLGLRGAIRARQRYEEGERLYGEENYRDAKNAFADALSTFTDAREQFEDAEVIVGPLESPLERYLCETTAGRLACTEYRTACREQLDGDESAAERRRAEAERRYTECD